MLMQPAMYETPLIPACGEFHPYRFNLQNVGRRSVSRLRGQRRETVRQIGRDVGAIRELPDNRGLFFTVSGQKITFRVPRTEAIYLNPGGGSK
jgi:hypothetical protein